MIGECFVCEPGQRLKVSDQPKAVAMAVVEGFEVRETLSMQWRITRATLHWSL